MKIARNFACKKYCLSTVEWNAVKSSLTRPTGAFQKVGECLYRYSPNGVYYARIKVRGKEIRGSLGTIDRDLAKRRLSALKDEQSQIDRSKSKLTLAELCARAALSRSPRERGRATGSIADQIARQSGACARGLDQFGSLQSEEPGLPGE